MKYWLFVTNEENWNIIKDKEIYGFNEKTKTDLEKLSKNDLVIIYIKGKKIGGIFKIINLNEITKIKFKGEDYSYKIKLKKVFVPKHPLDFVDKMINNISIFKNKARWGTILMGRATKEITKEDYYYFEEVLKC